MSAKSERNSLNETTQSTSSNSAVRATPMASALTNSRSQSQYDLSDGGNNLFQTTTKKSHNLKNMKQGARKQKSHDYVSGECTLSPALSTTGTLTNGKPGKTSRISSLFHRGNSSRSVNHAPSIIDLSYSVNRPDMVKIFCEQLRKGLESKGVKVSRTTTAGEVLGDLLKLLNIPPEVSSGYGLFDVVGSVDSSGVVSRSMISLNEISDDYGTSFVESCRRRIHGNEPLLQLDNYWQPKMGLCRRFEIRPLSKEEQLSDELYHRAPKNLVRSPSGTRLMVQSTSQDKQCQTDATRNADSNKFAHIPLGPFLLLLRGFSTRDDRLFYELTYVNRVGRSEDCQIRLHFTECPSLLCIIQIEEVQHAGDGMAYRILLESKSPDNLITVNGERVLESTVIRPGDILNFVDRYLFLFKDITQVQDCNLQLQHIQRVPSTSSGVSTSSSKMLPRHPRRAPLHEDFKKFPDSMVSTNMTFLPVSGPLGHGLLSEMHILCDVLREIMQLYAREELSWRIAGSYIIAILEYGDHHLGVDSGDVMRRALKTFLEDVIKKHCDERDGLQFQHVMRVSVLLFEVHFFYQRMLESAPNQSQDATHWFHNSEYFKSSTEDLMQVIFNGIIDNSPLISVSRAVLIEDPFRKTVSDMRSLDSQQKSLSSNIQVTMENFFLLLNQIVNTFVNTAGPCVKHLMHHFIYLLFATITKCLVLHILTDDSLLRWECGVKMRSNLDRLQEWLNQQELREVDTSTHLLSSVLDLLSMPKTILLTKSWVELRNLFPLVPPSLLNHLLQHYESGQGVQTRLWKPGQEDSDELAYKANQAVESYYSEMAQPNDLFYEYNRPSIDLRGVSNEKVFDMGVRKLISTIRTRQPRVDLREVIRIGMGYVINQNSHQNQLSSSHQPYGYMPREETSEEIRSSSSGGASSRLYPESMPPSTAEYYYQNTIQKTGLKKVPSFLSSSPGTGKYQSPSVTSATATSKHPAQPRQPHRKPPPGIAKATTHNPQMQQSNQLNDLLRLSRSIQDIRARNLSRQTMLGSMNSLHFANGDHEDELSSSASTKPRSSQRRGSRGGVASEFNHSLHHYDTTGPLSPALSPVDLDDDDEDYSDSKQDTLSRSRKEAPHRQRRSTLESAMQDSSFFELTMPEDLHLSSEEEEIVSIHTPSEIFYEKPIPNGRQSRRDAANEEVNYVDVLLKKENGSLGLGLIDASTTTLSRSGLFVKTIREGGPAHKSRLLDVGDEIVKVNHHDILHMPHSEAMSLIKSTGRIVSLRVRKADPLTRMHIENAMRAEQ